MTPLSFVALDLETTGINEKCEIIEIGMVKVEAGVVGDKFEKLIQPSQLIPEEITLLTGITNEMVADKPVWSEIQDQVMAFIGNNMLVAHNVSFDKGFLERAIGEKINNYWLDSGDLAKIVFPTLPSYKLSFLCNFLKLEGKDFHRAANDAKFSAILVLRLINELKSFSPFLIEKHFNLLIGENNGLTFVLKEILKENIKNYNFVSPKRKDSSSPSDDNIFNKLRQVEEERLASLLEPGGIFDHNLDNFEYRPQQVQVLNTIEQAFKENKHAVIEASTGTGKSLAYLLPSIIFAITKDTKIIIATNTIALQEQLFHSDIPIIEMCLGAKLPVIIIKGRNNYICLRKIYWLTKEKNNLNWSEKVFCLRILTWLDKTLSGDKEELKLNKYDDSEYWSKVSSHSETCQGYKCSNFPQCFYFKIKKELEKNNIIITNHSLLLQDIKHDNKLLPPYDYAIIDEAHNLEEEALNQFTNEVDLQELGKLISQLNKGKILSSIAKNFSSQRLSVIQNKVKENTILLDNSIKSLIYWINSQKFSLSGEIRVTENERMSPWWFQFIDFCQGIIRIISSLNHNFLSFVNEVTLLNEIDEEKLKELQFINLSIKESKIYLEEFLSSPKTDCVYWITITNYRLKIKISPLDIKTILRKNFLFKRKSVILTSATLAVRKNLDHFLEKIGLNKEDTHVLITDSPFNFKKQSLICIPNDIPCPSTVKEEIYMSKSAESIIKIIRAVQGGVLILFTSFHMLNYVYSILKKDADLANREILAQGKDGNRWNLIEALKNNPHGTIVLGNDSFWEGIDISGLGLTTVIITKLPFVPPTRPITAAKIELFDKQNLNSFYKFSLPTALLKFRQGYGRLIRNKKDWGTLIVLDNRIITKKYGLEFIKSLPEQTIIINDTEYIYNYLSQWMQNKCFG
ncbi:MAG: helicase C-terminal domain-containing protein [Bacillota bacterium]